jgi:hypothetical protein
MSSSSNSLKESSAKEDKKQIERTEKEAVDLINKLIQPIDKEYVNESVIKTISKNILSSFTDTKNKIRILELDDINLEEKEPSEQTNDQAVIDEICDLYKNNNDANKYHSRLSRVDNFFIENNLQRKTQSAEKDQFKSKKNTSLTKILTLKKQRSDEIFSKPSKFSKSKDRRLTMHATGIETLFN